MQEQIKSALSNVIYPGFTKDIVTFGFVKDIQVNGDVAAVTIEITSSAPEVTAQITDEANAELSKAGLKNVTLNVSGPKMPRESSSKGKNIAPHVKNFLMVSSVRVGLVSQLHQLTWPLL